MDRNASWSTTTENREDLRFVVEGIDGPVHAVVSLSVLRTLAGRSHVSGYELLSIYRSELEEIVRSKAGHRTDRAVRIETADL
jgi:hypothetical protein